MQEFFLKKGDRMPVLRAEFTDGESYVNLSGAVIQFVYQNRLRTTAPVTGAATIVAAESGLVQYAWTTDDVGAQGVYYGEWRATLGNGKQISFPNDSYISFSIIDNLH
jgi:hypothetical protein